MAFKIQTKGYYLMPTKYYEDYAGSHKVQGYIHNAFKFNSDGSFILSSKKTRITEIKFNKKDFCSSRLNRYIIEGDSLVLRYDIDKEWKHEDFKLIIKQDVLYKDEKPLKFMKF